MGIQFKHNDNGYLIVIRYGSRSRIEENYLINWYKRDQQKLEAMLEKP